MIGLNNMKPFSQLQVHRNHNVFLLKVFGTYVLLQMTFSDWQAITSELSKKSATDKCQASLLKKLFKR